MENTFFQDLFLSLTNAELRQLKKFVASPFFNGRPQLCPLLDHFCEAKQKNAALEAPEAFAAAFPDEPFDDQKWRLSVSQLNKLTEQFLAHQEMAASPNLEKLHFARACRKRNLPKHFQRTIRILEKELENQAERPAGFYENKYRIEWERYGFLSAGKRTEAFNLQVVSDALDAAFIAKKLRHVCFSLSHQAVFRAEYRFGLLAEILQETASSPTLLAAPAINLYYHCYLALTENREERFEQFRQLLTEQGQQLPEEERRNLYLLAINFGIRQINAGLPVYDRPVLDLYRAALGAGLLHENGVLSRFAYNNIVAIAVRIGEIGWVENFIHENKNALEREHRNVTFHLNLARLHFAKKNYGEALLHLQRSDFKDLINNLIAKTLQLKIYFETAEFEALEAHLRNMKSYLRRQRNMGYHKENYLNIIRFTQALVEMNPFDKTQRSGLRSEIEQTGRLTEKDWLLDMLA